MSGLFSEFIDGLLSENAEFSELRGVFHAKSPGASMVDILDFVSENQKTVTYKNHLVARGSPTA